MAAARRPLTQMPLSRDAAAVLSLMTVLSSHDDVLGYGSTVLFMITMLLAPPGGAEPAPRPPPRQADKRASARPDWVTDCLRDIVDGGALEVGSLASGRSVWLFVVARPDTVICVCGVAAGPACHRSRRRLHRRTGSTHHAHDDAT